MEHGGRRSEGRGVFLFLRFELCVHGHVSHNYKCVSPWCLTVVTLLTFGNRVGGTGPSECEELDPGVRSCLGSRVPLCFPVRRLQLLS